MSSNHNISIDPYILENSQCPISSDSLPPECISEKNDGYSGTPNKSKKYFAFLRKGETVPSIFNLIAATLGAGTITLPYIAAENGIVLAVILVIFGALISYY